jgi:hypothetical protein
MLRSVQGHASSEDHGKERRSFTLARPAASVLQRVARMPVPRHAGVSVFGD